jgi:hypothetical protein
MHFIGAKDLHFVLVECEEKKMQILRPKKPGSE